MAGACAIPRQDNCVPLVVGVIVLVLYINDKLCIVLLILEFEMLICHIFIKPKMVLVTIYASNKLTSISKPSHIQLSKLSK